MLYVISSLPYVFMRKIGLERLIFLKIGRLYVMSEIFELLTNDLTNRLSVN
jgi:hypothetical protein